MGPQVEAGLGVRVVHYYVNGNRTGDSSCFDDFDGARAELLRMIAAKIKDADPMQIKIAGRCMGEVADWTGWLHDETEPIIVGSDTWRILECNDACCGDRALGGW